MKRSGSGARSAAGDQRELAFRGREARAERRHASRYETIAQIRGTFSWKLNGGYRLPRASCGNGQYTPPTSNSFGRSRERERTRIALLSYGRAVVPHVRTIALLLDTHSLRLIIVIYAPATNAISLIRSSWLDPTARAGRKS